MPITINNPAGLPAGGLTLPIGTLGENLVIHYKCNDDEANTIVVDSENHFVGQTNINTSLCTTTGVINSAISTNSDTLTKNHIISTNPFIQNFGANDFTIALWYNQARASTAYGVSGVFGILKDQSTSGVVGYSSHPSSGEGYPFVAINTSGGAYTYSSLNQYSAGWHFLLVERIGANLYIYVDNALDGTLLIDANPIIYDATQYFYAGSDGQLIYAMNGAVDDVRVYSRALTSAERLLLWNGGNGTEEQDCGIIIPPITSGGLIGTLGFTKGLLTSYVNPT